MIDVLIDSDHDPIVVVDFARSSAEDTLSDLLRRGTDERGLYRIDAVRQAAACAEADVVLLAQSCAAELRRAGIAPRAVVGYCGAAVLTMHLARALADGWRPPAVLLVEPTWVTPEVIRREVTVARAGVGGWRGPLTLPSIVDLLRGEPHEVERYRARFGFLLATLDTPVPPPTELTSVLLSKDRAWRRDAPPQARLVHPVRLPLAADELLRSDAARRTILDLLAHPADVGARCAAR